MSTHSPQAPVPSLQDEVRQIEDELASFRQLIADSRLAVLSLLEKSILLSREEAAARLDSSLSQLDRWTRAGLLPHVDLDNRPRYRLEDLKSFAADRVQRGRVRKRRSQNSLSANKNKNPKCQSNS